MDHGLEITCVHQLVESIGLSIFKNLIEKFTDIRRNATAEGDQATANRKKLECNSLFRQTLTDKAKHSTVIYVTGEDRAMQQHAKPRFKCSRGIDRAHVYETELHKKMLKHDTPVQLGKIILDKANTRMCVYDFLKHYLIPGSYKLIQMDTNSVYAYFNLELDF